MSCVAGAWWGAHTEEQFHEGLDPFLIKGAHKSYSMYCVIQPSTLRGSHIHKGLTTIVA